MALQDIIDSLGYSWSAGHLWRLDAQPRATKRERLAVRLHLRRGGLDPERFDAEAIPPRKRVSTGLRRRAPLLRWLRAHVGRPWKVACAKLAGTQGVRSGTGREKLDHWLPSRRPEPHDWNGAAFYIDPLGILQELGQPIVWRQIDRAGWERKHLGRFLEWLPPCACKTASDSHDPDAWWQEWLARQHGPPRTTRQRRDRPRPGRRPRVQGGASR